MSIYFWRCIMKRKRVLSGAMAGIMAISSSAVLQLPAAAEDSAKTIIDARSLESWNPLDVDFAEYGRMTSETIVRITCRTASTDITVNEDGKESVPETAFGIVIQNDWGSDRMPRCKYDSSKTEFVLELSAEQLKNDPRFTIQNQLPESAEFTVEVLGMEEDGRADVLLPSVNKNIPMWVFDDSSWLAGSTCGGSFDIENSEIDGVTYGSTTIGELRNAIKCFSTSANPYYSDTLGIGADELSYNLLINYNDPNNGNASISGDLIDYDSSGVSYIDHIFTDDTMDDYIVSGISLYICAKTQWNAKKNKSEAVCEKLRDRLVGTNVLLEVAESSGKDITLGPCKEKSVTVTRTTWDDGTQFAAGYVPLDPGELSGISLADFIEQYHSVSTAAPGYFSNSAGIDANDLVYDLHLTFSNENKSDSIWLERDLTPLTDDCTLYSGNYADDLIEAGDYTLEAVQIRVSSKMENISDSKKQPVSEAIRNMQDGSSFTVEFSEDSRSAAQASSDMKYVRMEVEHEESWINGANASTRSGCLDVPGVTYGETTFAQLRENIKSITYTLPYYSDSIGAGSDAFYYHFIFEFADGSCYYASSMSSNIGDELTLSTDSLDIADISEQPITGITLHIGTRTENCDDGKQQAVSEVIRGLEDGSTFELQFAQDDRENADASVSVFSIGMTTWRDDSWLDGSFASGSIDNVGIPGVEYGKTTIEELRNMYRSLSCNIPYLRDSINAGSDAFSISFRISYDGGEYNFQDKGTFGETFVQCLDEISNGSISGKTISNICISVDSKLESTEDGRQHAVSESIRSLDDGYSFTIDLRADDRKTVTVEVPTSPICMNVFDSTRDGFAGNDCYGITEPVTIPGVEYGKTTFEDMKSRIQSITCNLPYYADQLSIGREAFVYKLVFRFDDDTELYFYDTAPLGETLTQLVDPINSEDIGNGAITSAWLKIEAAREDLSDGTQQAANETIRSLGKEMRFVLEPVKDIREDIVLQAEYPTYADVMVFEFDDENRDGPAAFVQFTVDSDCVGKTVSQYLKDYGTITANSPGYVSDELSLGQDCFNWQIGIRVVKDDADDYIMTDPAELGKELKFYTTLGYYDSILDYTIDEVFVKLCVKDEFNEDGKLQAVSEAVRQMKDGDTFYIQLSEDDRKELTIPGCNELLTGWAWGDDSGWLNGTSFTATSEPLEIEGLDYGTMTYNEFVKKYKSMSCGSLPYYTDSLGAGSDAFMYTLGIRLEGEESDVRFDKCVSFGEPLTILTNGISLTDEQKEKKITSINYHIEPLYIDSNGIMSAASEKIRDLEWGDHFFIYVIPFKPQNVSAVPGSGQVTLSWDEVKGADNYVVYSYVDGSYHKLGYPVENSFTATGLTNGKKYGFIVKAWVGNGWNDWSNADAVYATPVGGTEVQNVKTAAGNGQVALSWDEVKGAMNYVIYSYADGKYTKQGYSKTTNFTVTGLTNGKEYGFIVRSYKDGKWCGWDPSDAVFATPIGGTDVQNVKTAAGNGQVALSWDEVKGATNYIIYSYADGKYTKQGYSKTTNFTVTGLTNGKEYGFIVRSYKDGKWCGWDPSDAVFATPVK